MLTCNYLGRFAPSPTGALHAGSLATALGSWLHARAHDGKWLLRIEDLDLPRCIPGTDKIIISQLEACGLYWDGDIEYQSKRTDLYKKYLNELIVANKAFGCRCTRKQIEDALVAKGISRQRHDELIYPGTCRDLGYTTEPCAWRLRVNQPHLRETVGDFVLRRADGIFTYQLAVVVDDQLQGITHIVRGADLLDNTERQIYLQEQLGFRTPEYLHLPLVLDKNQEKLSKQTKAEAIAIDTPEKVLKALQAAGRHLNLSNPSLFDESSLSAAEWLEIALKDYKQRLLKK
ncbi:tRNA glutamyl-Q(34) synthetase GluQRS [Polynucleobacter sp. MWH-Spelu-300-X4]|uniref:tRNA glutamyl-Q(34) synthetase GluQRS n=1 Tax=Polynucleobacter sp. MWH-Spelu-300-X4 TaxID=2689109 RepID=UPI001BFE7142|nr:tRNA glutamyl-Q(34) synthetase GluQRS [Polynucleobacter sp. MWH-Spelu-300-X4]QWD80128.1 tRNA glutamyl-Q(34) synthetase GluQRS [Polynucleobacter sp. MWH-Spelu-300-X4]